MVGANPSSVAAVVTAQVMAGPWNEEMKRELFARTDAIVRDVAEMPASETGGDFWMTFVEVEEGGWGYGGQPMSIERLSAVFAPERQKRIRAYLDRRKN